LARSDTVEQIRERMRKAQEKEARDVDILFSTKAVRIDMGGRTWLMPVNYWTPKGRDETDRAGERFGFVLFLPEFGGFTKENWKDPFDSRRIDVQELSAVDKNAVIPYASGGVTKIDPAGYGEPRARFNNRRRTLEDMPSFELHGLKGYRQKGTGSPGITWTGTRSNGEFFFFESTLAPGQSPSYEPYPICATRYYSEQEDLFIAYRYSQQYMEKWREIDDAIWMRLHQWRLSRS